MHRHGVFFGCVRETTSMDFGHFLKGLIVNRSHFSPILVCGIFCVALLFTSCRSSAAGIQLSRFVVKAPPGCKVGDTVEIGFTFKNVSSKRVVFADRGGVFVAARLASPGGEMKNRDFGYKFKGHRLAPGKSLSYQTRKMLKVSGNWTFFPAYRVQGSQEWSSFERRGKTIKVGAVARLTGTKFRGPGKTVVVWKGKHLPLQVFPRDNPWNQDISKLPLHPQSRQWIANIGRGTSLHPDFGTTYRGAPLGIPYIVVRKGQRKVPVSFKYRSESDPGPYPVPLDAPIEGGSKSSGDRHVIVVDYDARKLYELYSAHPRAGRWEARSGAIFDLRTNKLRPRNWTSADAAGLPIFSGLVRYEEVHKLGEIRHALRFTARKTQKAFIPPATHHSSNSHSNLRPPMGMRVRLRAGFDIRPFPPQIQVILKALKKYGMFLADNGGNWYISGAPNARWDMDSLATLKRIKGKEFEVVKTGDLVR